MRRSIVFLAAAALVAAACGTGGTVDVSDSSAQPVWPEDAVGTPRALPTGGTPLPDIDGALLGDDGTGPLPLGTIGDLPDSTRLDFLFEFCWSGCYRDAHFMDPDTGYGSGIWTAGRPFHVAHGFVNDDPEPLGAGFDLVLYVTELDEPGEFGRSIGDTYRYTSDYVVRGETDRCGPGYEAQTEPQTCEWFLHDFPEGLPEGRFALWAVWEAPCSAWLDLGMTTSCDEPDQVISLFSSGFDAPFGSHDPSFTEMDEGDLDPDEIGPYGLVPGWGAIEPRAELDGYHVELFYSGLMVPNDLEVDGGGRLLVSETEGMLVRRIDVLPDGRAGGSTLIGWDIPDAEGLAVAADGVVYVADSDEVYRIVDERAAPFIGGFNDAEGLAVDDNGDLYVADDTAGGIRISRVEVLADGTAGPVTEVATVPGVSAADIDFGPGGDLYVANDRDAVWRLEFGDDGSVESEELASFTGSPNALAFDEAGALYVGTSDPGGDVWMIEPGQLPVLFSSGFGMVEGLAVDEAGAVYVVNVDTNEIWVIR